MRSSLADRILAAITEPYDLDGRKIVIGTSIGITLAPQDANDADVLVRTPILRSTRPNPRAATGIASSSLPWKLRRATVASSKTTCARPSLREEFELHYQTIIDVGQQACCGAEALVRWRHPERGLIPPDQFIRLAEESGLIVPLGEWILRQACADAAKWPPHQDRRSIFRRCSSSRTT